MSLGHCSSTITNLLLLYIVWPFTRLNFLQALLKFAISLFADPPSGYFFFFLFFFSTWVFFHNHSRITELQGKEKGISLTPHYHFHPLHRHLDISRAVTAESSFLHKGSSRTRTGNLWFPSASG